MAYTTDFVQKIKTLRSRGHSIKELAKQFGLSPDTVSRWVREIKLNQRAINRLQKLRLLGQDKARDTLLKKGTKTQETIDKKAKKTTENLKINGDLAKLCCALLYWCEGNKNPQFIRFTSSDNSLIRLFLELLRTSFHLDEKKFRALVHLHEYHNETKQKKYWSDVTKIPLDQFYHSYLKPNTGKRKHIDYAGCLAISYYDHTVAKELQAVYNSFVSRGVVQRQDPALQKL